MGNQNNRKEDLRKRIEEVLRSRKSNLSDLGSKTLDEILEEVSIYHQELEYQNIELQRIHSELEQSKSHYFELFQDAPLGYVVVNEINEIQVANEMFAKMVGSKAEDLNGKKITSFIHPDFQDQYYLFLKKVVNEKIKSSILVKVNGVENELYTKLECNIQNTENGQLLRMGFLDVTREVINEQQLIDSRERYRAVADYAYHWEYWQDYDGRLLYMSPSCERITGYSKYEFFDNPRLMEDIIHPDDKRHFDDHKSIAIIPGETRVEHTTEYRIIRKDGEVRWIGHACQNIFKEDNTHIGLRATNRDITERKKIREKLNENLNLLSNTQEIAHIGSWELDVETNQLNWSDEIYRIFGIEPQQFKGSYEFFLEIVHPDDRKAVNAAYVNSLRDDTSIYEIEHRIVRRDNNEIRYVYEKCYHERDNSGRVIRSVGMVQDITKKMKEGLAIAESEKYLRTILQTTTDGFWVVDKNRRMVDVNQAYLDMVGYTRDEYLTLTINDIDAEEKPEETAKRIERIIKNGSEIFETRHRRKDGSIFHVEVSVTYVNKNGGQIVCFCRDITDRLIAKQKLEEDEQKYRLLVENTQSIAWEYDIAQDKWVYVAPQSKRILGYKPEEWTNYEFWATKLHPDDRDWATRYCAECTERGQKHAFEYRFRKKDGEYSWLRDVVSVDMQEGKPVKMRGLILDISQRKLWEQNLVLSDRIFKHTVDMLCIAGFDGYFKTLNPSWGKTLGWSTEELMAKPWIEFVHMDDRQATKDIRTVIVDGQEIYQFENRYICKDGTIKWLSWNSYPYPNEKIMFGVARDVTYKKQAEEKLRSGELQLKEQVEEYTALNEELSQMNEELQSVTDELIQSNHRNNALLQALPDIMFVLNRKGVFLSYHSPNQSKLLVPPSNFINKNAKDVLPEYLAKLNQEVINKLFETGETQVYSYPLDVNGVTHHFDARMVKLGDDKVLSIVRDITEQKSAEERLLHSHNLMQYIIQYDPNAIAVFDKDMNYIYVSQRHLKEYKVKEKDVIGKNHYEIFPDLPQKWRDVHKKALKGIVSGATDHPYYKEDGTVEWTCWECRPWFESDGSIGGVIVYTELVTERKEAELALQQSEERFKMLFEKAPVGYQSLSEDGRFIDVNETWLSMLGYTKEEVIGRWFGDFLAPEYVEGFREGFPIFKKEGRVHSEFNMVGKDGSQIFIALDGRIGYTLKGEFQQTHCTLKDITEQRKAELALKKSQEILSETQKITKVGGWEWDVEKQIMTWTDEVYRIHGLSKEDISDQGEETIAKSIECYAPEHRSKIDELFRKCVEKGEPYDFEVPFTNLQGEQLWIRTTAKANYAKGKIVSVIGNIMDITKEKMAEQALRESEEKFRLLFENMTQGFALHEMILDDRGRPIDYRYLSVNKAFEELTGVKAKQILGKTIREVLPNTEQYWIDTFGNVANTGKPFKYDNYSKEIGKYFDTWCFSPRKGQFAVVFSDVTEKKLAEDKVLMLTKGIEQSPAIVVITDTQGTIEYVNPKFTEVTGYSINEVLGQNPRVLKSGHQGIAFYQNLWNTILSGNDWQGDMLNLKKNGEFYWESALISPIKNEKGETKHFIAIKEDITYRKKAEEALIQSEYVLKEKNEEYLALNEELTESNQRINQINKDLVAARKKAEESDKLKTAFLANMSHEIRTPMNAIIGFSEMLLNPSMPSERKQFFTRILNTSCHQLLSVVEDVIDIAKIETGQMDIHEGKINVNHAISRVQSIFIPQTAQQGVEITTTFPLLDDYANILTDATKLNQVLTNLVSNAAKFTEQGSISISYSFKDNYIEFCVKDTGIGISPEHHEVIFERFRQVELESTRKYGGTGLGLSISKAFVEALGGRIWVESEIGMGTSFHFTLPYKPANNISKELSSPVKPSYNFTGKLILVAEDEDANFMLISEMISDTGGKVLRAENGKEAVEICNSNQEIDIVLMDIKMPVMNGIDATRAVKALNDKLPVIALTAYALSGDREKCFAAGCDEYLSKPITMNELMRVLSEYLDKK